MTDFWKHTGQSGETQSLRHFLSLLQPDELLELTAKREDYLLSALVEELEREKKFPVVELKDPETGVRTICNTFANRETLKRVITIVVDVEEKADEFSELIYVEDAPCQEVVHKATDPDFDLFKLVPAPTNTPDDAGPYITLGMCYATHPDTGLSDVTIHRMCIQSKDELSIFFTPGARHIGAMAERAEQLGQRLPISISIGVDPALEIGSCFEAPTTPMGYDELAVAGALRGEPVKLCKCLTVNEKAIANAEYVIEGEVVPGVRVQEDQNSHSGFAMPEFPGYTGPASSDCWLIKVTAVTTRKDPIMQTCIGPSEEHVSMAGIPTEASIWGMVDKAMPGRLQNVYCASAGGGKYMAVLQFKKLAPSDEGRQRQAALLAFSAFSELKHIFLVDEDVDCFDMNDVLWAMNTRFQGDADIITIPGVRCHPLDPSNDPSCSKSIRDHGIACKTIFDCTVPYDQKARFVRARFMDVDPAHWVKE